MPNMISPSSGTIQAVSGRNQLGWKNAMTANSNTQTAKVLPIKRLRAISACMADFLAGSEKPASLPEASSAAEL